MGFSIRGFREYTFSTVLGNWIAAAVHECWCSLWRYVGEIEGVVLGVLFPSCTYGFFIHLLYYFVVL